MSLIRFTRLPLRNSIRQFSVYSSRMAENKDSLDAGKGSVGKEFTPQGKVGGTAQQVGGPFDKEGAVGKQFTTEGSVGSTAQDAANKGVFDKEGVVGRQFDKGGNIAAVGEAVGGPFSSEGAIGKHFKGDGAVGGTVQENLGSENKK
ncbi:hypothetical protein H2198_003318 [Neophaeococcomyces mojaviensis]|uniref:Uncharacterized protein n=1 Tax=Neophaeococcomyces mojaviensis TaxID=3383035 RepID=A0ACC3ABT0_9EURO|nr:hypothetical protein H2198_003318 [Knufia sp. JES_112]